MEFYVILAAVIILIGLWNLMIAILGCFPQCRASALGTLTKANTRRNVETKHGHKIPILTRYSYTYTVNGRKYRYSSENLHSKRRLLPKMTMVYVKWFPRRAYPTKFKGTNEWLLGLGMLFMGGMLAYVIMSAPIS